MDDLLLRGKVFEAVEAEIGEEFVRRPVDERVARGLLPADDLDQLLFEQGLQRRRRVDAAQGRDLGLGDGLVVGDRGQRLQGGRGELVLALDLEEAPDPAVVVRAWSRTRSRPPVWMIRMPAVRRVVAGDELVDGSCDLLGRRRRSRTLLILSDGQRLQGDEDQGFDDLLEAGSVMRLSLLRAVLAQPDLDRVEELLLDGHDDPGLDELEEAEEGDEGLLQRFLRARGIPGNRGRLASRGRPRSPSSCRPARRPCP